MKKIKIAVIIPAYNEAGTVGRIVSCAKKNKNIDEVIVVSDGSTDKTATKAKSAKADKVFELKKNRGKGHALLFGAKNTNADILIFLDADIFGFKPEYLDLLAGPVLSGEYAMLVGLRDRGAIFNQAIRHLPLISGIRALRRFVILGVPEKLMKGYKIEASLNYYCKSRKLKYGTIILRGLRVKRKTQKVGFLHGLWQYIKMFLAVGYGLFSVRIARILGRF